jgi:cysteine desulfurase
MSPFFSDHFGNPNSLHLFGRNAQSALDDARSKIAALLDANFSEIVFTSGATESNNIALNRTAMYLANKGRRKFVTTRSEHKSVLDCSSYLKSQGIEVAFLNIQKDGLVDLEHLSNIIDDSVSLLSICMVNNETGVLQDVRKIVDICHDRGVLVHTDATQAFGKIPINLKDLEVDFLSCSGHKIYGPKGIGALFYRQENKKCLRVPDSNHDVEFGIRSGTIPVALCVGMGKASEIAGLELDANLAHIASLRKLLIDGIFNHLNEIYLNGSQSSHYPGILNVSFRGCEGEALMMECKRIAVASGSACTSNRLSVSHVLDAMNVKTDISQSSIRISIGKSTSESDILTAVEDLIAATVKLREMSPIWDMITAGMDIDSMFEGKRCGYVV